jgi:hypothetical protein
MWILQFLPDAAILWFCNTLLMAGLVLTIAEFFIQKLPFLYQYQLPFRVVGIALLTLGVYFRGGYAVESEWRERVTALEAQLKVAQEQSTKVNTVIQQQVVTKTRTVREKANTIIERIEVAVPVDAACPVPPEAIEVHNEAARMNQVIEQQKKAHK